MNGDRNTGHGNSGHGNEGHYNTGNLNAGNCNPGNGNFGHGNAGDGNSGHYNTGYDNVGNKNAGSWNKGYCNAGDSNTGYGNPGSENTGNRNTGGGNEGNRNTGHGNTGSWNTGDRNTGSENTGHGNTGNGNTGSWNSGDGHVGFFNCQKPTIFMFDAPTDISAEIFVETDEYKMLCSIVAGPCVWVPTCRMTVAEKKAHGGHTDTGGYLKQLSKSEQGRKSQQYYNELTDSEKLMILGLPKFDAKKFKICTGIDVCESEGQLPGVCPDEEPTDSNSNK